MLKFAMKATVNTQDVMRAMSVAAPQAVKAAAELFVEREKANVPVDTGNLRDHIEARDVASGPYYNELVVAPAEDAGNEYGFDPAYARRIEYGFFGPDRLGRVYHQAARPYVRPAWDEEKDAALDAATQILSTAAGS